MKRFIAALAVVAFAGTMATASAGMQFGIRGQFNINQVAGDGFKDFGYDVKTGIGFGAGLVVKRHFTQQVSLVSETSLLYRTLSKMEVEMEETVYSIPSTIKIESSQHEMALSLPLMLQVAPVKDMGLYLTAGIQLDFPFNSKFKFKADLIQNGQVVEKEEATIDADGRSAVDFGIPMGLGYMITPNIGVDFRFVLGLIEYDDKTQLRAYAFGFTYIF